MDNSSNGSDNDSDASNNTIMTLRNVIILLIVVIFLCFTYLSIHSACNDPRIYVFDTGIPGPKIVCLGGTHGNEPAGSVYLEKLIKNLQNKDLVITRGKLTIIPRVNACGVLLNMRNVPGFSPWDINRHYDINHKRNPHLINQYIHDIDNADLIIDLHEGWGYYYKDVDSVGSGVYAVGDKVTQRLANDMLSSINKTIGNKKYKFGSKLKTLIDGSLHDYCSKRGLNYILIEITGQNDVQPLRIRVNQIELLMDQVLRKII